MKRRTRGDMAKVRRMPKKPYPFKDADFGFQVELAYHHYKQYQKCIGHNPIMSDEDAFKAGVTTAFGWTQKQLREKGSKE